MAILAPLIGPRESDPTWLALAKPRSDWESRNRLSVELLFHSLAMGYSFLACRPVAVQTDETPCPLIGIEAEA
jgi:hypothetical protein